MTDVGVRLAPDLASLPVVPADLSTLDRLVTDALAVFCFSDVRPLLGAAAMLDWRLCGRLSRALERGHVTGARGEVALLPTSTRRKRRVFVFGLGPRRTADRRVFREACREAARVLRSASAMDAAYVAPLASQDRDLEGEFLRGLSEELAGKVSTILVAPV